MRNGIQKSGTQKSEIERAALQRKILLRQIRGVTEWTPEMARIAVALTKLHEHLDDGVYLVPEDEWQELEKLTYYGD